MSTLDAPNPVIELVKQRFARIVTKESRQKALNFVPRSTDVFVVTPMKTGTTWLQQIMHQLRSGGDMTFADIEDVIPWIEIAYDLEQDLDAEQKYQPRCFKSHFWYEECPKGGKYILVYREPCATMYSMFNFFHLQPKDVTLDEFVKYRISSERNYFAHLLSWWPKRNDPNVLFLFYEDMLEDLESAARAVASFMNIDDEASITNAVKMSTFDFMKQNKHKFATSRASRYRKKDMGGEFVTDRVMTGSATKGRDMMEECTKQVLQKEWNDTIAKETGLQDYNEFKEALKKEKQS